MSTREPKKATRDIRKLAEKYKTDPEFAALVFDVREVMQESCASPNHMRAALRLVLHQESMSAYRYQQGVRPKKRNGVEKPEVDPEVGPFFPTEDDGGDQSEA